MNHLKLKFLTICSLWMFRPGLAQEIWSESFTVPGKGIHGYSVDSIYFDFDGIVTWGLDYDNVILSDEGDYAETVATSGGRFEACDINGEIIWRSEWIIIDEYDFVSVELTAAETGSGSNASTKYMKICYQLDEEEEEVFESNGFNSGNWGSLKAEQGGLSGSELQIVCYISTHYASDKVILDEVTVRAEREPLLPVKPFEVVINELMADPVPSAGLPAAEYIELYNTRASAASTEGWKLRINDVAKNIPTACIEPGGYILLCSTGSRDSLVQFDNVLNVPGFQGLLNNGARVGLLDENGEVIDEIEYADTWYRDDVKSRGGWSLERIDPLRNCNQSENWLASTHQEGGTPGALNSVFADNPDVTSPYIRWAIAVSGHEVEVEFSEQTDSLLMNDVRNYSIAGYGNPDKTTQLTGQKIKLHFNRPFEEDIFYSLYAENIADECNNQMTPLNIDFQWNIIEPGDVLVNEILYDPYPGCADFVEVYNRSEKMIDLSQLYLGNRDADNVNELNQTFPITAERLLLYPGDYLALTTDTASILNWYRSTCPSCFLQMKKMPSYPNESGHVVLLNKEGIVLDEFNYNEDMHSPFLSDTEGISLERLSVQEASGNIGNWHSASEDVGYATPGYRNSQTESGRGGNHVLTFEPEAFSPNYDGYNDEYRISYQTSNAGNVVNINVFDGSGRYVRCLAKNIIMGTEGEFLWNGDDEYGNLLPLGVYVVVVEIYNSGGEYYKFKDGVVLTDILN